MEIRHHRRFERDLRRIRDPDLIRRVEQSIEELEAAASIAEVRNVERVKGREHHYRARIGDYRLGFALEGSTAVLLRFMHRREIYRSFP